MTARAMSQMAITIVFPRPVTEIDHRANVVLNEVIAEKPLLPQLVPKQA